MSATMIMAVSVVMYVLLRWAKNEKAVTLAGVISGAFVIGVIALLDRGATQGVAQGFAWLFFVVVAYNFIPKIVKLIPVYAKGARDNVAGTLGGSNTDTNTV